MTFFRRHSGVAPSWLLTVAMVLMGSYALTAPKPTRLKKLPAGEKLRLHEETGTIDTSIYSLPSSLFSRAEARLFLAAVRDMAPNRKVVVLTDLDLDEQDTHLQVIHSSEASFSPWPRDPFTIFMNPRRQLILLNRPDRQPGREDDYHMAEALSRGLRLADPRFEQIQWANAPFTFHNGQILFTSRKLWVDIHTLEHRILELTGWQRLPVERFGEPAVLRRLCDAAREAADELANLYGRRIHWVHPLPDGPDPARNQALVQVLGGGAGYDLDSLVTVLARPGRSTAVLVGSISLADNLLREAPLAELDAFSQGMGLAGKGAWMRDQLQRGLRAQPARALADYLDLVAASLIHDGLDVVRLPLLPVDASLVAGAELVNPVFLVGWQNVVAIPVVHRAEGFASLLPSGDRQAREAYASLGYELDLLPPLVPSVLRGGGYRCASKHLGPSGKTRRGEGL